MSFRNLYFRETLTEIFITWQIQKSTQVDINRVKCFVVEIIDIFRSRLPKFCQNLIHGRIVSICIKPIQKTQGIY